MPQRRGVDAVFVRLPITAEHFAAAVTGMQHSRTCAGFGVSMPHKATAAHLCDVLLSQACGAVNTLRVDPEGWLIGETFDGIGMVRAITAHPAVDAATRVLLVGAEGAG